MGGAAVARDLRLRGRVTQGGLLYTGTKHRKGLKLRKNRIIVGMYLNKRYGSKVLSFVGVFFGQPISLPYEPRFHWLMLFA
jgi:hypothetical protein